MSDNETYVWYVRDRSVRPITKHRLVKETACKYRVIGYQNSWGEPNEWMVDKEDGFLSFDEAKQELLTRIDRDIESAKMVLHQLRTKRGQIESMKEPEC